MYYSSFEKVETKNFMVTAINVTAVHVNVMWKFYKFDYSLFILRPTLDNLPLYH